MIRGQRPELGFRVAAVGGRGSIRTTVRQFSPAATSRLVAAGRALEALPAVAAAAGTGAVALEALAEMAPAVAPAKLAAAHAQGVDLAGVDEALADNALAAGHLPLPRTHTPHVVVRVDLADLIDPATGPGAATLGFEATTSAARARWLACDGGISRLVIGPDGDVLDHGRRQRVSPPHLRRALDARDRSCVFTGCHAPTHRCDVHHLIHWADGGQTDLHNCAAVRSPPHQGPPRIPRRTPTRRPMAHLAARRHRDPRPPPHHDRTRPEPGPVRPSRCPARG
ncbi:DUF222 domain-containing protein [Blastococcus sp. SYSU DS0533]